MNGETAVPAQNRTAVVAILVAAVALGAFALVGIGVLLGWIPRETPPASPGASAPAKASNGLQKFSGSEPLMPKYSQPHPPPPAPPQSFQAESKPAAPQAMPVPAPMPAPPATPAAGPQRGRFASEDSSGPAPPVFGPAEPRELPVPVPQRRGVCEDCGRVIGIANWRSGWEVRVRFEDGSVQTLRFRRRPPFDLGERVRLDHGELVPD